MPNATACITRTRAQPRRGSGFTLIELLVVIVVLGTLATLVTPNIFRHVGSAKETTARTQIEMLGAALDAYRLDIGRYPTTQQGLDALWVEPTSDPRPLKWGGPYVRKAVPRDPWGRVYLYRSPGESSRAGFEMLSYGADGKEGGAGEDADIASWK